MLSGLCVLTRVTQQVCVYKWVVSWGHVMSEFFWSISLLFSRCEFVHP